MTKFLRIFVAFAIMLTAMTAATPASATVQSSASSRLACPDEPRYDCKISVIGNGSQAGLYIRNFANQGYYITYGGSGYLGLSWQILLFQGWCAWQEKFNEHGVYQGSVLHRNPYGPTKFYYPAPSWAEINRWILVPCTS